MDRKTAVNNAAQCQALWRAGMGAYVAGRPRSECPFPVETQSGVYWGWGWDWCARDDRAFGECPYQHPVLAIWWLEFMAGSERDPPPPFAWQAACPVLGELSSERCAHYQDMPLEFAEIHPTAMALYRACRSGCPFSKLPKEY